MMFVVLKALFSTNRLMNASPSALPQTSKRLLADHPGLFLVSPLLCIISATTPERGATGGPVSLAAFLVEL